MLKVLLIMAVIGIVLYGIDMLVCKISPKAGYVVAIFNICFLPVGIVTFILTQKYLEKKLGVYDLTVHFREEKEQKLSKNIPGKMNKEKVIKHTASPSQSTETKKKEDFGRAEDWDLEYATSIDDLHMRMIGLQGCKNLEEFKKVRPDLGEHTTKTVTNAEEGLQLVIPQGTTGINDREFENREDIVSVVIPNGVKRIGEYAFSGCTNLKSIVILSGVKEIGYAAFRGCEKLTEIEIPAGVTKIGGDAFYDCKNLKTIVIPESVQEIGIGATIGCYNLDSSIRGLIHSKEPRPTAEDLECMYIDPVNPSHPPRTVTIEEVASRLYGPGYGKNK